MGPLAGLRIIEVAGLGPGPFCGMMLGDMGADVVRIDRHGTNADQQRLDPLCRNRRSLVLDLKSRRGVDVLLRLVDRADALFEGFRPGVAERLGFGPDVCLARNERLVYGRVTGWGQDGPLASAAGHDINYIALAGALAGIGQPGSPPTAPLNLVGDFGGGGMLLAFGLVCALLEARRSGKGQVVDAAMIDGSNALMATFHGMRAMGLYDDRPGTAFLSGAAHYYGTYETRDGKYVAIGPLEPQFYALLIEKAGLDRERFARHGFHMEPGQAERENWAALRAELAAVFRTRTRAEWCALLEGTDACFAPVLTGVEAARHPHHVARGSFIEIDGVLQHAPAPRFSRTPAAAPQGAPPPGGDTHAVLHDAGLDAAEIDELARAGVIGG
ncbi:MAG: CoA transferase [Gammaproteobacteria bacterium]|nr:CoA transferase [Gammaproteobacteria bacterium]